MPTTLPPERIPVIAGVGEIADHPKDIAQGLEPLALLEAAVQRAGDDSAVSLLPQIDSLDVVNFLSWRYHAPAEQLATRLGIAPRHCFYGPVGGESPIRFIHEAALRIARGEAKVAVVCGAEAQSTATKAARAKLDLPWTPFAHDAPEPKRGAAFQQPIASTLGVARPITVYPLYEAATAAHWGQTPRQARSRRCTRASRPSRRRWPTRRSANGCTRSRARGARASIRARRAARPPRAPAPRSNANAGASRPSACGNRCARARSRRPPPTLGEVMRAASNAHDPTKASASTPPTHRCALARPVSSPRIACRNIRRRTITRPAPASRPPGDARARSRQASRPAGVSCPSVTART